MQREVLGLRKRVLGAEHPESLVRASKSGCVPANQGQHANEEHMRQATLASCQRVLGPPYPSPLQIARN
jgi:hypothetical protein